MPYSSHVGTTIYTIDATPFLITALLLAVHLLLLWATMRSLKIETGSSQIPPTKWAVIGLFGVALMAAFAWIGSEAAPDRGSEFPSTRASQVFFLLFLIDATAILCALAGGLSALIMTIRRIKTQTWPGVLLGVLALASAGGLSRAFISRSALSIPSHLPVLDVEGPALFHVGHTRPVKFRAASWPGGSSSGHEWQVTGEPITLTADAPKRFTLTAYARNKTYSIEGHPVVEAVTETSGPLMPLQIGNRWEYQATGWCLYESGRRQEINHRQVYDIAEGEERFGLHMFGLRTGVNEPNSTPTHYVFAAGGQTYGLTSDQRTVPVAELRGDNKCRLGLFETDDGTCYSGPLDATFALPGPESWKEKTGISNGGSVFLGLVTLGAYKPEAHHCETRYKLIRSIAGPRPTP